MIILYIIYTISDYYVTEITMDSVMFYWVLTLVILIILAMLTDIPTAGLVTAFLITIKYIIQPRTSGFTEGESTVKNEEQHTEEPPDSPSTEEIKDNVEEKPPELPKIDPQILVDNAAALEEILNPGTYTADDKIFDASVNSGYKEKKAKEIRSHWNNDNWKRYYDYELGIHETENREWWTDNDYEINKKHVVI